MKEISKIVLFFQPISKKVRILSSSLQVHARRVGEVLVDVLEGAGRAEEVVDGAVEALLAFAVLKQVMLRWKNSSRKLYLME